MLILSILLNCLFFAAIVILFWYAKRLWNIIEDTKEGIKDMKDAIQVFSEHLQTIYKQDVFYGEPTIERLIKHSKILTQEIEQFITLFLVPEPEQAQMETNNDDKKKETRQIKS